MKRTLTILCSLMLVVSAFAGTTNSSGADQAKAPRYVSEDIVELANHVDIDNLQFCSDQIKLKCDQRTAFAVWRACTQSVISKHSEECKQSLAIFNAIGDFPWQAKAVGSVTLIQIKHLADGMSGYYMIDHQGRMISLADERDDVIKNNPEFLALKAKDPKAGIMGIVAEGKDVPKVVMPKHKNDNIQIIFPMVIKSPNCVACQTVGDANVAYNFDAEGNFVDIKWLGITK